LAHETAISTKLPSRRQKNEFYRYYAGYPVNFALCAIEQIEASTNSVILDPWNGSGTTAAACASLGMACHGYDVNPVMVHLGRARSASDVHFSEAREAIATVQARVPVTAKVKMADIGIALRSIPPISDWARSAAIAALFPFARAQMVAAKTKNPSWFKSGTKLDMTPIAADKFFENWHRLLHELHAWRAEGSVRLPAKIEIELGDSRDPIGNGTKFDAVITSPPYLTRLDYVQATLPEYLLTKELDHVSDIKTLRDLMIGSPLTSDRVIHEVDSLPQVIKDVLSTISCHPSKASSTYYYKFFATYFVDLQTSLRNISCAMKPEAQACIVVQSSHYKEIEVNLGGSIIALGQKFGLHHQLTYDFDGKRSMSEVNSRAHALARKPKHESAIFLKRA